jgi:hypothetical protein
MTPLTPDLRKRRVTPRELLEDAALEYAESQVPTLRAYHDERGWCLLVDEIPFRARSAFAADREQGCWNTAAMGGETA